MTGQTTESEARRLRSAPPVDQVRTRAASRA
jgi:hypothetical protein